MSSDEKTLIENAVEVVMTPSMRKAIRGIWVFSGAVAMLVASVITGTWQVVSFVGQVRTSLVEVQAANGRLETRINLLDAHSDAMANALDGRQRETEKMVQRHEAIINRLNN